MKDHDEWGEAARKAVLGTSNLVQSYTDEVLQVDETRFDELKCEIAKHHAELRATYKKLVELAWAVRNHQANHGGLTTFCSWCDNIDVLLADPLVQSAIERSKKV